MADNTNAAWLPGRLIAHWAIILILVFSVLIRASGLNANLPNTYWHDENNSVEGALKLGTGNLKPMTLQHGMLLSIILAAEYGIYFAAKLSIGAYHAPMDLLREYITDPTVFYMISRATVAFFGIASVLVLYLAGLALYKRSSAAVASLLFSVSLLPVVMSKWTKDDLLATFLLLLGFLASLRIYPRTDVRPAGLKRYYLLSGFFVGLGTAAKLNVAFGAAFILTAHIFAQMDRPGTRRGVSIISWFIHPYLLLSAAAALLGFIAGNPYVAIDPGFFVGAVTSLSDQMFDPHKATFLLYFTDHLRDALGGRLIEIVMLASCIYSIFRRGRKELLMLSFPVVLYLFYMRYPGFAHYMIPALPFLLLVTASFLMKLYDRFDRFLPRAIIVTLIVLAVAGPIGNILRYNMLVSCPDTRTIARKWIEENLPSGTRVLSEGYISTFAAHAPQIRGDIRSLRRDIEQIVAAGGSAIPVSEEISISESDRRSKRYDIIKRRILTEKDLDSAPDAYVVVTGYHDMTAGQREFHRDAQYYSDRKALHEKLEKDYVLVIEFAPKPAFSFFFPIFILGDLDRLETIRLSDGAKGLCQGPLISIYRRNIESL